MRDGVNLVERRHVDDDARARLRLAERGVPLAPPGDADAVLAGEAHHLDHVFDRAGPEDGDGRAVNDVAEVVGGRGERGGVGGDRPVERRQLGEVAAAARLRHPGAAREVEPDDG